MEFLVILAIVESVTYAYSTPPIVGAPGLDFQAWDSTNLDPNIQEHQKKPRAEASCSGPLFPGPLHPQDYCRGFAVGATVVTCAPGAKASVSDTAFNCAFTASSEALLFAVISTVSPGITSK